MRKPVFFIMLISIILNLILISTLINKKNNIHSDPTSVSLLLNETISKVDYDSFKSLFLENYEKIPSKEEFHKLKYLSKIGSSYNLFEIIQYDNGEIILIKFSPYKINDEYKIIDIKKVKEEDINKIKEYFLD